MTADPSDRTGRQVTPTPGTRVTAEEAWGVRQACALGCPYLSCFNQHSMRSKVLLLNKELLLLSEKVSVSAAISSLLPQPASI